MSLWNSASQNLGSCEKMELSVTSLPWVESSQSESRSFASANNTWRQRNRTCPHGLEPPGTQPGGPAASLRAAGLASGKENPPGQAGAQGRRAEEAEAVGRGLLGKLAPRGVGLGSSTDDG